MSALTKAVMYCYVKFKFLGLLRISELYKKKLGSLFTYGRPKWPRFYDKKKVLVLDSEYLYIQKVDPNQSKRNFLRKTTFIHFHFRESFFFFFSCSFLLIHCTRRRQTLTTYLGSEPQEGSKIWGPLFCKGISVSKTFFLISMKFEKNPVP